MWLESYTQRMSVTRDELHHLVDQLPEERLASVLELIRGDAASGRKTRAAATLERVRERMHASPASMRSFSTFVTRVVADASVIGTGVSCAGSSIGMGSSTPGNFSASYSMARLRLRRWISRRPLTGWNVLPTCRPRKISGCTTPCSSSSLRNWTCRS